MKKRYFKEVTICVFITAIVLFVCGCDKVEQIERDTSAGIMEATIESDKKPIAKFEIENEEILIENDENKYVLTLEEATAIIKDADDTIHDIMKSLEKEENKGEDICNRLEEYFDATIIDYVLFTYQIMEENGEYIYTPYAEYALFWMDSSKEMCILSQGDKCYEIGVVFRHAWKTKQEEEIVPVKLEWKEDTWKITDISQWYNDFRYLYMQNESFSPEYFTKEQAENLIESFGMDEEGNRVVIMAEADENGYIMANSSEHLLSKEEINGLSEYEMYLAIQEIYARHGKKFCDPVLYEHFSKQNWYAPYGKVFSKEIFSETETANIKILAEKGDFTWEADKDFGNMYTTSENRTGSITEEEAACMIYHAFDMADEVITCRAENYMEEKSQDVIQFYSLGEYSDEGKLKNYLSGWFDEKIFDYLVMIYNTWTGLYRDENGNFYVSQEGTYPGEAYEPYFSQKVTVREADESRIVAEVAFYNYGLSEINTGEIILDRKENKWLISSISHPYYDKLFQELQQE